MTDAVDRSFSLSVNRTVNGEREISVSVTAEDAGQDMTYTSLKLVRKLREFPRTVTDGYELWSSALASSALSHQYDDDLEIAEGETAYYTLFALDANSEWKEKATVSEKTVNQNFSEISGAFYPDEFLLDSGMSVKSTAVLKVAMCDAVFSEIESLIRQFPYQLDPDTCGPLSLALMSLDKDWPLSPLDDIEDARTLLKAIKSYMRTRGTEETEEYLLARVSHCDIRVWRGIYHRLTSAGPGGIAELTWELEQRIEGTDVGGGDYQFADTLEVGPLGLKPWGVRFEVDGVVYTDNGEGSVLDPSDVSVGTVTYSTGAFDITVPSTADYAEVDYVAIVRPVSAGSTWLSDAVVRNRLFKTADSLRTVAEIILDDFLDSDSYESAYTVDLARKIKKFWSAEGRTDFILSVKANIVASADMLIGRLPIDNERGKNDGYSERSSLVQG